MRRIWDLTHQRTVAVMRPFSASSAVVFSATIYVDSAHAHMHSQELQQRNNAKELGEIRSTPESHALVQSTCRSSSWMRASAAASRAVSSSLAADDAAEDDAVDWTGPGADGEAACAPPYTGGAARCDEGEAAVRATLAGSVVRVGVEGGLVVRWMGPASRQVCVCVCVCVFVGGQTSTNSISMR
jgi:biotin carboxyl carrier protein